MVTPSAWRLADIVPELLAKLDVDAGGRLVEDEDRRRMDHRLGDQQPALHAARQGAGISVGLVLEPDRAQQLDRPPVGFRDAVEAGLDLERLARREEGIEQDLLRHDSDRPLGVARILVDVEAPDRGAAAALGDQAGEDVDQGRLAGAVGPEQAENAAARDVQGDAVERPLAAAIGLLQVADRDGRLGHGVSIAALTLVRKRRLTAMGDDAAMFMQLHLQGLSRTALLISGVGAILLALLGAAPGAV